MDGTRWRFVERKWKTSRGSRNGYQSTCLLTDVADQLFRRKMNRNGLVAWTVSKKAKNQGLDCIIERVMEILKPGFDKVDIGVGNAATMLEMKEMRPILHVLVERHVVLLAWGRGLHNRNRYARMAGNGSHFPKDLIAAKLGQKMPNGIGFQKIASTADQGLI